MIHKPKSSVDILNVDPITLIEKCWSEITLYDKQKEIIYSVENNIETVVPAGNELGKDFIAALAVLVFFLRRRPCRVITTSVQSTQLEDVLWGELRRFIETSEVNLPILYNHMHIRQIRDDGTIIPLAEIRGQVTAKGESLLGRHLEYGPNGEPTTMAVFDEASGISDKTYESSDTWTHRKLIIGNCYPTTNFFYRASKEGDLVSPSGDAGLQRKVIRIKAEDSPNVRLAKAEIQAGNEPSHRTLIPGVVTYRDYLRRRALWDPKRQSIGLDAEFYEGAEVKMYPPEWLQLSKKAAQLLKRPRKGFGMGCDPAEGGDNCAWCISDEDGLILRKSLKTPDTSIIVDITIELMKEFGIDPANVVMDRGGGGKQHADRLRTLGYDVRTVAFGGTVKDDNLQRRMKTKEERTEDEEDRSIYKNRRAQMWGALRDRLNPDYGKVFAIPEEFEDIYEQLRPIPLNYDGEGRLLLPPKSPRVTSAGTPGNEVTLIELVGHSPDEVDALVMSIYAMDFKPKPKAG